MPAATTTIRVSGFGSCTSSSCFHMFWIIARYGGTFLHTHYNAASGTPKPSGGIFLRSSWGGLQSALCRERQPGRNQTLQEKQKEKKKKPTPHPAGHQRNNPPCSFLR